MTDEASEFAPAKINLALHVRERRSDGYHDIDTLFAFVDVGDVVRAASADRLVLNVVGPFGNALDAAPDNLVLRAASALKRASGYAGGAALTLDKHVPVASGIGGGSADAAATLRLLDRLWDLRSEDDALMALSASLGADVPACLLSRTAIGSGKGDVVVPVADDLGGAPMLLVNSGTALSTATVFAAWDGGDGGALPAGPPSTILQDGRNDLEKPAISVYPSILEVLTSLRDNGARVARMSGSGATCFGVFDDAAVRDHAASAIGTLHPDWWVAACRLTGSAAQGGACNA